MTLDDEPLDDDMRALLACEAAAPELPAAHVERARRRLALQIGVGMAATPAIAPVAPETAPIGAAKAPAGSVTSALTGTKLGAIVAIVFVAGAATGWFARGAGPSAPSLTSSLAPVASFAPVVVAPPPAIAPATRPIDVPPSEAEGSPSAARALSPPSSPPRASASASLAVSENERALLDQAKRAVREGDAERALALVAKHEHDHPRGALGEERDVLRVTALVAAGRRDEAAVAAERFRREYPASLFLRAVDSQLEPR